MTNKTIKATIELPVADHYLSILESNTLKNGWYNLNVELQITDNKITGYSNGILKPTNSCKDENS